MNGKTVVSSLIEFTFPQHVTTPCLSTWEIILLNISPPTVSTPAENLVLSSGLIFSEQKSSLKIIFFTPRSFKNLLDSTLPVIAVTSILNLDKRPTAIDPTPPVAPDTTTGNSRASVF